MDIIALKWSLLEILHVPTNHVIAAFSGSVFREGDRREAELRLLLIMLTLTMMMLLVAVDVMVVDTLFIFVKN
jgi:hypothetical protein